METLEEGGGPRRGAYSVYLAECIILYIPELELHHFEMPALFRPSCRGVPCCWNGSGILRMFIE